MTERPINLHAHEVRAALAGTLGLIVRPVKPQPVDGEKIYVGLFAPMGISRDGTQHAKEEVYGAWSEDGEWSQKSPFGQPGAKLWGRETWAPYSADSIEEEAQVVYRASYNREIDGSAEQQGATKEIKLPRSVCVEWSREIERYEVLGEKWRPSTHMPQWASRITLETTAIAVKQVRDITEAEAMACGFGSYSPAYVSGGEICGADGVLPSDEFDEWYQKQYGDGWAWFCSVMGAE